MRGGHGVLSNPLPSYNVLPLKEEMTPVVASEDKDAAKRPEVGSEAVALVVAPHLGGHVGGRARHLRRIVRKVESQN